MGEKLADGAQPVYAAVRASGAELAVEFLDKLTDGDRIRMLRIMARKAEGHRLSKQDFRKLSDGIFEFKDYQNRMLCFSTKDGWFVTHGFVKKKGPIPPREIKKAKSIRSEHRGIK